MDVEWGLDATAGVAVSDGSGGFAATESESVGGNSAAVVGEGVAVGSGFGVKVGDDLGVTVGGGIVGSSECTAAVSSGAAVGVVFDPAVSVDNFVAAGVFVDAGFVVDSSVEFDSGVSADSAAASGGRSVSSSSELRSSELNGSFFMGISSDGGAELSSKAGSDAGASVGSSVGATTANPEELPEGVCSAWAPGSGSRIVGSCKDKSGMFIRINCITMSMAIPKLISATAMSNLNCFTFIQLSPP
ncbi:MAG: hypothetical protein LBT44_00270 [Clostridiales bacterium]|nr:hypothetical protein [Clostridiales bacterium]